jgi:ribosomal RNA-processing protein 36
MKRRRDGHDKEINTPKENDIDNGHNDTSRMKRVNKNAPAVMRSDKPVKRLRIDPNLSTNDKSRDPRFSEISGKLDHKKFMDSYAFLDDYQVKEIEVLSKKVKKVKTEEDKLVLKSELLKAMQELKERKRDMAYKKRLSEMKSVEKEKVCLLVSMTS